MLYCALLNGHKLRGMDVHKHRKYIYIWHFSKLFSRVVFWICSSLLPTIVEWVNKVGQL